MNLSETQTSLIALYADMAALTKPECLHTCRVPKSCCNAHQCAATRDYAKQDWGVQLEYVDPTASVPFLGTDGCIVPPHLRPVCSMHTCAINSLGFKPNDEPWTTQYFALREQIEALEFEVYLDNERKNKLPA